ncbi:hypothetical protein AZK46_15695 [Acinetobacter baumannii]|uniref:hypothetical protein n=1 Tax=Acinetobacter baumannii TaxID=470 RepID=UPI0007D81E48|nr:hypothetical protein [Acinetobacter baumannii]OAM07562.1 hypothetical protein AZK46_15695 [Acinetobacter baumannii]
MDKPQSFEEVFKDAYDYWIDDADIHRYEGAKGLADQVWQHQQAKVEKAQTNGELLNEALQRAVAREDELQKRVDFLEKHLKPCECGSNEISVDQEGYITKLCYRCGGIKTQEMIEQALKGEG